MRLPRAAIVLHLTLSVTHGVDIVERRVRGLQKGDPKDDKGGYYEQSWDKKAPPPPPPLVPPSYAPQYVITPPTISPIQNPPYGDDYAYDDYRGTGKGKGKGTIPPPQPPETDDDFGGKGKGKGKGMLPPNTDDYYYQDDRGGKGKGKGGSPPPPPPPPPPGKGKGKGLPNSKNGKSKKDSKIKKQKSSKYSKSKMAKVTKSTKSKSSTKGKGKGKGFITSRPTQFKPPSPIVPTKPTVPPSRPPATGPCSSSFSSFVEANVPEAIAKNPIRCCDFDGATAAVLTHALPDNATTSGFEPFWNNMYEIIDAVTKKAKVCFFMTGYNPSVATARNLSDILIDVNQLVSSIQKVPSMMSTDPTDGDALIKVIRKISSNPAYPSVGVFNAGYDNIQLEKLESGLPPIPYVGYTEDQLFGSQAAQAARELLGSEAPVPLCFNARVGMIPLVGARCQAYYAALQVTVEPSIGVSCNASTTSDQVLELLLSQNVNTVWSHIDCCKAVSEAAQRAQQMGRNIIVGCQDDAMGAPVDFVTQQAETLQGYATSTWANFPVIQELQGRDGRAVQYFPSLSSLVNTAIYNMIFQ